MADKAGDQDRTAVRGLGRRGDPQSRPEGIRPLYGFLNLPRQYTGTALEKACERALSHGTYSLRDLRRLLEQPVQENSAPLFMDSHPLIRDMAEYGAFLETLYPEKEPFAPPAAQYNKEAVEE